MLAAPLLVLSLLAAPASDLQTYYVVLLRPHPQRVKLAEEEGKKLQAAHMAHIRSMAQRGKLIAAGPFGDTPPTISGIFIFETPTLDEARREAEADPTVAARRNTVEIFTWRGPQGIGADYRRLHAANPQTPEAMGMHPLVLLRKSDAWNDASQREHEAYLAQLRAARKLAAAGPASGEDNIVSLVVFDRIPFEEAERLTSADPAVQSGALKPELHRWWCSAHVLPWAAVPESAR